ncbi:MAG: P-loop NTPase [Rickettsiaceae bacterium]|nr:P-loop NTPase [Rickettsiaceae bacterium]
MSKASVSNLAKINNIILVASCKGGVGKSTVSSLLARQLASKNLRVGLMDADIYGPSIPTLFGLENESPKLQEQNFEPIMHNGIKISSIGFLVPQGSALAWRGPMLSKAINQLLLGTLWGELDYLIIDMPPGTGDIHLSIQNFCKISGVILVTIPDKISIIDVERAIDLYKKTSISKFWLIENMSYMKTQDSYIIYPFGLSYAQGLADKYNIQVIAKLPFIASINDNTEAYLLPEMQINFEL